MLLNITKKFNWMTNYTTFVRLSYFLLQHIVEDLYVIQIQTRSNLSQIFLIVEKIKTNLEQFSYTSIYVLIQFNVVYK